MTLLFSLFVLAHADAAKPLRPRVTPYASHPTRAKVDTEDPVYRALARIFPNFMSGATLRFDAGLYRHTRKKLRHLPAAHRAALIEVLNRTSHNPDLLREKKALGIYWTTTRSIELADPSGRMARVVFAHELQHAIDHLEHPRWYSFPSYRRIARLEWRASRAESEYMSTSFTTFDLAHEYKGVTARLSQAKVSGTPFEKALVYFRKKLIWVRQDVLLAEASELGAKRLDDVMWSSQILMHRKLPPKARASLHVAHYVRQIMVADVLLNPITWIACAAALAGRVLFMP